MGGGAYFGGVGAEFGAAAVPTALGLLIAVGVPVTASVIGIVSFVLPAAGAYIGATYGSEIVSELVETLYEWSEDYFDDDFFEWTIS